MRILLAAFAVSLFILHNITTMPIDTMESDELEGNWFDGDMMLSDEQLNMLKYPKGRNVIAESKYRWPNGRVLYTFHANISAEQQQSVLAAMAHISSLTCVRFQEAKPTFPKQLIIQANETRGCISAVGYRAKMQYLNLGEERCFRFGVIVHELLHTLGLYHQHMDLYRDNFIQINYDNIIEEKQKFFRVLDKAFDHGVGYDFDSIMHYGLYAFSKNGLQTIEPKCPGVVIRSTNFGNRGLSEKDIMKIKIMYECPGWEQIIRSNETETCA